MPLNEEKLAEVIPITRDTQEKRTLKTDLAKAAFMGRQLVREWGIAAGATVAGVAMVAGGVHAFENTGPQVEQPKVINTTEVHKVYTVDKNKGPITVTGIVADAYPAPTGEKPSPELRAERETVGEEVIQTLAEEGLPHPGLQDGEVVPLPPDSQIGTTVPGDPSGVK